MTHRMPTNAFFFIVLAAGAGAQPAQAQSEAGKDKTPPPAGVLRPASELKDATDPREELGRRLERLHRQTSAAAQVEEALRKGYDGSGEGALKIHLVGLLLARDEAELLASVGSATVHLRWSLCVDKARKRDLEKRRQSDVESTQMEIAQLADLVVREEESGETAATATTPDGLEGRPSASASRLADLVDFRNRMRQEAAVYAEQVKSYEADLTSLEGLEAALQQHGERAERRVREIGNALDHERDGIVSRDVERDRQTVRSALAVLGKLRPQRFAPLLPNPERDKGVPASAVVADYVKAVPPPPSPAVIAELELARARRAKALAGGK